jgi:hypothetical protein
MAVVVVFMTVTAAAAEAAMVVEVTVVRRYGIFGNITQED